MLIYPQHIASVQQVDYFTKEEQQMAINLTRRHFLKTTSFAAVSICWFD